MSTDTAQLVSIDAIRAAAARIAPIAMKTPLVRAAFPGLSGYGTGQGDLAQGRKPAAHRRLQNPRRIQQDPSAHARMKSPAASSPIPAATTPRA